MELPILAAERPQMPKYGVGAALPAHQMPPQTGRRRHTSVAVKLVFHLKTVKSQQTKL